MAHPKQPKQIDVSRQALAPYNFVELPERVATVKADELPDQDRFHGKRHSGWFDCVLRTESPLYVRAGAPAGSGKKDAKDQPEFFYVWDEDEPIIPGSTLRGMLRSLVEIVSFSKVSEVTRTRLVYRAVGDTTSHGDNYRTRVLAEQGRGSKKYIPTVLGGYMVKSKQGSDWYIRPAQTIKGTTFAILEQSYQDTWFFDNLTKRLTPVKDCYNAYKIYVRVGEYRFHDVRGGFIQVKKAIVQEYSPHPQDDFLEATLALSGPMSSKRSEAVIFPVQDGDNASLLRLSDKQIEDYLEQVSKEQSKLLGKPKKTGEEEDKRGVLRDGQPVFYTLGGDGEVEFFEFLGHCRMLRLPYPRSPYDLVPPELRREEDLDLAEAIFGYTKKKASLKGKEQAFAGRVSVCDAHLKPNQSDKWLLPQRPLTPRILATPKPTCFQQYLVQPTPNQIPAGTDKRGNTKYTLKLRDYTTPTPDETVIRGHKSYWHKGPVGLNDIELKGQAKDTQLTKISPLRAGLEFSFRLHFDNLSSEELGALVWVLQKAGDDKYRLKVGMGKPLGLGAVKVTTNLKLVNREQRYQRLFDGANWLAGTSVDETATRQLEQKAAADFERFVLGAIQASHIRRLEEHERIKQLLALLGWPGPPPERTRYLEIERDDPQARRGKRNEYKNPSDRPVLPDPLVVTGAIAAAPSTRASSAPNASSQKDENVLSGVVKFYRQEPTRAYGFIKSDSGGKDVHFTREVLPPNSNVISGKRVKYVLSDDSSPAQPKAKKVIL